ncbi:MAG: hypothetical protein V7642_1160 [Burkholderiales bacterium]|jgi:hypothetical protein
MPGSCMQRGTSKMKRFHRKFAAWSGGGRLPQPRALLLMICCAALLLALPAGNAAGANGCVVVGDAAA